MTKTDAVAIFAEGTFEDQVRALLSVHCGLIQGESTDRRARRVHLVEQTRTGTCTICPINSGEACRRRGSDAFI
jgi:hypothetical protein